jgi:hypothetical protein
MESYLQGRLRNTPLPLGHGLLPLFEAVVNSIHSIEERGNLNGGSGKIGIEVLRSAQTSLALDTAKAKRGVVPLENILGFRITDDGVGFNDANMNSFRTLDTAYKASLGCRGVGRLLWLKAFERVKVVSCFRDEKQQMYCRSFAFTSDYGVKDEVVEADDKSSLGTSIELVGFAMAYRDRSAKSGRTIAQSLLEHCLWYFVRPGGAPEIRITDEGESIGLDEVYDEYMFASASKQDISIKGEAFELTHIKLKASAAKQHSIAWCASGRLVQEESISGKVPGLFGRLRDESGDFVYECYVTSPFLDQRVRPERFGFDINEISEELFSQSDLSLKDIRDAVASSVAEHLKDHLDENKKAGRERVERFAAQKAPRYRPMLARMSEDKLDVDPNITDKELDLLLHKQLVEIEGSIVSEGHEVMNFGMHETPDQYRSRLASYLEKVDDLKKSDLANYVFHRKVILDILEQTIRRGSDGKYAREELIHELIMPMRKTSNDVLSDGYNLWLVDERLAFHDFLASDKPLSSYPITKSAEQKEPDICALSVYDEPILVAEGDRLPLASIVVVEIKRPMRNDAKAGEEKDPVEQALGYLERIRKGGAQTAAGRPIPRSEQIPGFCYAICDITPSVENRCKLLGLKATSDNLGYFGYNSNFESYIEVISFERLLNSARERSRAFFDKLGLPTQ